MPQILASALTFPEARESFAYHNHLDARSCRLAEGAVQLPGRSS